MTNGKWTEWWCTPLPFPEDRKARWLEHGFMVGLCFLFGFILSLLDADETTTMDLLRSCVHGLWSGTLYGGMIVCGEEGVRRILQWRAISKTETISIETTLGWRWGLWMIWAGVSFSIDYVLFPKSLYFLEAPPYGFVEFPHSLSFFEPWPDVFPVAYQKMIWNSGPLANGEPTFIYFDEILRFLPLWGLLTVLILNTRLKLYFSAQLQRLHQIDQTLDRTPLQPERSHELEHQYRGQPYEETFKKIETVSEEAKNPPQLNKLSVATVEGVTRIEPSQISHVQVQENYCYIVLKRGTSFQEISIKQPLKDLLAQLPSPPFVQTHRSFLVNLEHVTQINTKLPCLVLHQGQYTIPISRRRLAEVVRCLENH